MTYLEESTNKSSKKMQTKTTWSKCYELYKNKKWRIKTKQ